MDIQAEKLNLIKWITDVKEPSVIEQFLLLKNKQQADWWDHISPEERSEIETGIVDADIGDVLRHEEVMEKYQQWRSK